VLSIFELARSHNGSSVAVQLALPSWEGAEILVFGETLSAQLLARNGFWAVNLGSVFRLDGNLDSRVEVELVRSHLEKRLENCFIVHRANEAGT